jgi:hypothetical protein
MDDIDDNEVDGLFREHLTASETSPSRKVWNKIAVSLDKQDRLDQYRRLKKHFVQGMTLTVVLLSLHFALSDYSPKTGQIKDRREIFVPDSGSGTEPSGFLTEKKTLHDKYIDVESSINSPTAFHSQTEIVHFPYESSVPVFPVYQKETKSFSLKEEKHDVVSQNLVKPEKGNIIHRFSIEPFFIKEFAGYNFADNDVTGANGKEIEERERTMFSATLGLFVNYTLNRHWYIQTGLSYSWSTSDIDSSAVYARRSANGMIRFKLNTVSGYSFLNSPSTNAPMIGDSIQIAGTYSYLRYVSIPVIINYQIPLKRFYASFGAGATFNMLNSAEVETDEIDANLTKHESQIPLHGLKKNNFGLIVKAEIAYQLNTKWSVNLLSSFKNALGPININSALSAYPYNIGVGLGIVHHFN